MLMPTGLFTTPAGGSGVTEVTFLDEGPFTDLATDETSKTVTLDMSGHDGVSPVMVGLVLRTRTGWGASETVSVTLDGDSGTLEASTDPQTANENYSAIFLVPGASFAASSSLAITTSTNTTYGGAAAWAVPVGTTVDATGGNWSAGTSTIVMDVATTTGGAAIGIIMMGGNPLSFTGLTASHTERSLGGRYMLGGHANSVTTETRNIDGLINGGAGFGDAGATSVGISW